MRRFLSALLVLAALGAALAAGPVLAKPSPAKHFVALSKGRGTAILDGRGTVIGLNVARGSVRIVDLPAGPKTKIVVKGYERVKRINARTRVYSGRDMWFYVSTGRWRVQVVGRGIRLSAKMTGRLILRGTAGTYAIDDGPAKAWPETRTVFSLL